MNARLLLVPLLLLLPAGCVDDDVVDSAGLDAEDLGASLEVVVRGSVATATASFRVGEQSTPIVRLVGDDAVKVARIEANGLPGTPVVLEESWTDADWPEYIGELEAGAGAEEYTFVLELGGNVVSGSSVLVAPDFVITRPSSETTTEVGGTFQLVWSAEPLDDDDWAVELTGACVSRKLYPFPTNPLTVGPLESGDTAAPCEAALDVRRSLDGTTSPTFLADASSARGKRIVAAPISVVP